MNGQEYNFELGDLFHTYMVFREVQGLNGGIAEIDLREPGSHYHKEPPYGFRFADNPIVLIHGEFLQDMQSWDWLDQDGVNNVRCDVITIRIRNIQGRIIRAWELMRAWPVGISGSGEGIIDRLEIAYVSISEVTLQSRQ